MANLLKEMELTSVDLTRAGANQEADICLYKSAQGGTEGEIGLFKRFMQWMRNGAAETATEAHSGVAKADMPAGDVASLYKSAFSASIESIVADGTLTDMQKCAMIETSVEQYMEAVNKSASRTADAAPVEKRTDDGDYIEIEFV